MHTLLDSGQHLVAEWLETKEHLPRCCQHGLHCADEVLEQMAALVQHLVNPLIYAVAEHQVDDANDLRLLADAIDASDALFDARWVPREVIVD
ncbi:MAG: hypothetical protein ACREVG_05310 [Burkholderiales bacterium]